MATFSIPDQNGNISQPNNGPNRGTLFGTYGIDLDEGVIHVSSQVKEVLTDADDVDFSGYAAQIAPYAGDDIFAISDVSFDTNLSTPISGWVQSSTSGTDPSPGNTVTDACEFDGLFIVQDGTDLVAWNGTTWSSYWQGTLGQSALTTGQRFLLKVGSDGDLFLTNGGNKVLRVDPVDGATASGAGTLDFSATSYIFTCMEPTASRLFIGAEDTSGGEGVILEWDMSPSATTVNRIHKVGTQAVRAIAVKDNVPYAVLSDGRIKYFNGGSFVDYEGFRFPVEEYKKLSDDFIHPNGWDIIDDKLHFLVTGKTSTQNTLTATNESYWSMPAGVWCLDPNIGLYCRFPIGAGEATQEDYGRPAIKDVGALFAIRTGRQDNTKFLASYEYYTEDASTVRTVLAYHDNANTQAGRGWLATTFATSFRDQWKRLEMFNEPLPAGCEVRVYSRGEDTDPVLLDGTWASTTVHNTLTTGTGLVKGDIAYIKSGKGANQWVKISDVTETGTVTSITLEDANTFVTAGDKGAIEAFDFRYMGTIDNNTKDLNELAIPGGTKKRKRQFLLEFRQAAQKKIEVDYVIVTT